MTSLALALALGVAPAPSPPPWYRPWRVVETPALHVGLRPAAYVTSEQNERAAGLTVQVTVDAL